MSGTLECETSYADEMSTKTSHISFSPQPANVDREKLQHVECTGRENKSQRERVAHEVSDQRCRRVATDIPQCVGLHPSQIDTSPPCKTSTTRCRDDEDPERIISCPSQTHIVRPRPLVASTFEGPRAEDQFTTTSVTALGQHSDLTEPRTTSKTRATAHGTTSQQMATSSCNVVP